MDNKNLSSEALLSNNGDMTSFRYGNCVENGRDLKDVEKNYGIRFSKPL